MPTPSFADQMADLEDAVRRERRPLRAFPPPAPTWRQSAADIVNAEIKHATEDFWQSAHRLGAGLLFDRYKPYEEARPFRFPHEVRAAEARDALSDLNLHEGVRHGPWSMWVHLDDRRRVAWRARWFHLARLFLRRMQAYATARTAVSVPNVVVLPPVRPVRPADRPGPQARTACRAWGDHACRSADRRRDRP
jgi:hypothetical protein